MDAARTPLMRPDFHYVAPPRLDEFRRDDWELLGRQRRVFDAEHQADHALRVLAATAADPAFGYQVNNFRHSLQAATAAMQDGRDEEYIVVTLFHDVGFTICPGSHGAFAAAMLSPYVSDASRWILERHQIFQAHHCHDHPDEAVDPDGRERWRGHEHFAATAEFVEHYDITTIAAGLPEAPLSVFAPMVKRLLTRPPRLIPPL